MERQKGGRLTGEMLALNPGLQLNALAAGDLTGELTRLHRALSDQGFFQPLPDWKDALFSC